MRKKVFAVGMIVGFFVGLFLFLPEEHSENKITGYVTAQEMISSYPEFFRYGSEKNRNLITALQSISYEFNKKGVTVTPELLVAVVTTLRKEVGGTFEPVEEYGDFCMGSGCTYKIGGTCRNLPYDGGCDYKGRGYIQITHAYNYKKHCGDECLVGKYQDVCQCNNRLHCAVKDVNICKPAKALLPEYAGKIFVSFYISNGLVALSNNKNYWSVGKNINDPAYATDFSRIAQEELKRLTDYTYKTSSLLNYLNTYQPEDGTKPPGKASPIKELPPRAPPELPDNALGVYSIIPSFETEIDYDLDYYQELAQDAQDLLQNVEACKQLIGYPGEPVNLYECVWTHKPSGWQIEAHDGNFYVFSVPSGKHLPVYDEEDDSTQMREIVYKFALYIEE